MGLGNEGRVGGLDPVCVRTVREGTVRLIKECDG